MSRTFATLIAVLLSSACGNNLSKDSRLTEDVFPIPKVNLKSLNGRLSDVKIVATEQGSFHTVALINYTIDCTQKLESFHTAVSEKDGEFNVYASAIVSDSIAPGSARCLGLTESVRAVFLSSGAIGIDQVRLTNLDFSPSSSAFSHENTLVALENIRVVSADPLCPTGLQCIVNGTIITVEGERSCAMKEGFSTFATKIKSDESLELAVGMFGIGKTNQSDEGVPSVCAAFEPQILKINLINQFYTLEQIQLIEVN